MFNLSLGICCIILLFLVPGALFRKAFNSVKLSDYHVKASGFSEIVLTIALSVFIQFLGLAVVHFLDFYIPNMHQIDFHAVTNLITSKDENVFIPLEQHALLIISYQITLYVLCVIIARFFLGIIINYKLDQKFNFLRFDNEWHYILSGRTINPNKDILKYANVLVDMDDFYLIYTGFLADYNLDKTGNLKLIELEKVKRKIISKDQDKEPETKEYKFNVDSLFIPYDKILNFSITYYNIELKTAVQLTKRQKIFKWIKRIIYLLLFVVFVIFTILKF